MSPDKDPFLEKEEDAKIGSPAAKPRGAFNGAMEGRSLALVILLPLAIGLLGGAQAYAAEHV